MKVKVLHEVLSHHLPNNTHTSMKPGVDIIWKVRHAAPEKSCFNLTCVRQTPAICIFSQQAAESVSVLV